MRLRGWTTGLLLSIFVAAGCGGGSGDDPVARGRSAYLANCVACHNTNPKLAGPIGPELAGVPAEVIEAKVLRNQYPPGYTPKRNTKAMVPLPHLEPKLDDIIAYLGSIAPPSIP